MLPVAALLKERRGVLSAQYRQELQAYEDAKAGGVVMPRPREPSFLLKEPTAEGIYRALQYSQPSQGLFTAEGAQFVGGHGMTLEAMLRTSTALCDIWDGEPLSRTRGGEPSSILEGRRLSAHLMMQPGIAATLLSDPTLKDQGLLSRLLVTAPDSLMGTRLYRDPDPVHLAAVASYNDQIAAILDRPMPFLDEGRNILNPRALSLSPAAKRSWEVFHDKIERRLAPGGLLTPISGFAAKLPEQAARIGGVLALSEDLDAGQIEVRHLDAGIALARHYGGEAYRIFSVPAIDPDLALAVQLGGWLLERWAGCSLPLVEIYQKGPKPIRSAAKARQLMGILEKHHWVVYQPGKYKFEGVDRTEFWYVVPQ